MTGETPSDDPSDTRAAQESGESIDQREMSLRVQRLPLLTQEILNVLFGKEKVRATDSENEHRV